MAVFVDTSAIYAALSADDAENQASEHTWGALARQRGVLVTSNYVLLETIALAGRRLGLEAVRDIQNRFAPVLQIEWVDQSLHQQAMMALLTTGRRDLSLVDCVSFALMHRLGLDTAFTFDAHFADQGFHCIP